MVILNNVVPVNYNKMKRLLLSKVDEKTKNIIDRLFYNNENKNKYTDYILKNINQDIKDIMDNNHYLDLFVNYNYCNHIYKHGKREGMMCCAKIFIKPNDKKNKYLCSRHCRNYNSKPREYSINKPRCNYIKNNGKQCKHICSNFNRYCYIHEYIEIENNKYTNEKINKIEKFKFLRKLYFKNKYKSKRKYNNKNKKNKNKDKNKYLMINFYKYGISKCFFKYEYFYNYNITYNNKIT